LSGDALRDAVIPLLMSGSSATDKNYADKLELWTVSSESFISPNDQNTYMHYYDTTARKKGGGPGRALIKEARRCKRALPVPHPNASAFVCFAEERMDLCRAVITGPIDTPYAFGLFVFDVFFPTDYPNIPPLVTFMTTGGGQTRMNPNLYQDGKVCISLLGTTLSDDESQRWNPGHSSIAQVLLSIQTQLFVEEPYFNEAPRTKEGKEGSKKYNMVLRLGTLRHAIIAHLRSPPVGMEDVVKRHFDLCRKRIIVQARRWADEAEGTNLHPRFERAYAELITLFAQRDSDGPSLEPLKKDLVAVAKHDENFHKYMVQKGEADDTKMSARDVKARKFKVVRERKEVVPSQHQDAPSAATPPTPPPSAPTNPWSMSTAANPINFPHTSKQANDDDDDDDDMYD